MSLRIIEHKKNELMEREEIRAVVEHHGKPTPTRGEILPILEGVLKKQAELIFINKIFTEKGKGESKLKVFVYQSKDDMPKHRTGIIQKRVARKSVKSDAEAIAKETKEPAKKEGKGG